MTAIAPAPLTKLKTCRYGPMVFLRADRYVGASLDLYGEYCLSESQVFEQLLSPGDTVVEVGANIGAHTVHLSQLVGPAGRVLAFEPQHVVFQILCANIVLNEAFNVRSFNAGSGDVVGTVKLPDINYALAESNFGAVSLIGASQGNDISIIPLDTLDLPSLRLIKIDVEGMEAQVIKGAASQISRHRPVLYVENDRRDNSAELISLIQSLGYDLWWHFAPLFSHDNYLQVAENIFGGVTSINMLCIHKEEARNITGLREVSSPNDWWEAP
jgi:FkbM family methyltransferase